MTARDEILTRLHAKSRPATLPGPWQSRRHFADLVERFTRSLTAVHGEAHVVTNLQAAWECLGTLFEALNPHRVVVNQEPPFNQARLPERWPGIEWLSVGDTPDAQALRAFCATADVGLSGAAAALAETGSIVVESGPGQSRLATLLPPVHIALVPTSKLTSDLFTWTAVRPALPLPANRVIISGPSKTADIEQTMSIGVHGPKRFIVILFQEEE